MSEPIPPAERFRMAWDRVVWAFGAWRELACAHRWWPGPVVRAAVAGPSGVEGRVLVRGERVVALKREGRPRAVALPVSQALRGDLVLGPMRRGRIGAAVREALWAQSPLPPEHMVAAWRSEPVGHGLWRIEWVLARRSDVERAWQQTGLDARAPAFVVDGSRAWPLHTEGTLRWLRRRWGWDVAGWALVGLALLALAVPAFVPAALQRQGVVQAMQQVRTLQPQAEPVRQRLDALRQRAEQWEALRQAAGTAVPLVQLVEVLAAELPDDTLLDRLEVSGLDVRIGGLTPNATALQSRLARHPLWSEVRAANAAVRDPATGKDRFTFDLRLKGPEGHS